MPHAQPILTAKDLRLVEELLQRDDMDARVAVILGDKIASASVVPPEDVPPNVVTLDSRVHFTIGGQGDVRRLVFSPLRGGRGQTLMVETPLGATLLGMRPGNSVSIAYPDGSAAEVTVVAVLYQPESTRDGRRTAPTLRVVSSSETIEPRRPASRLVVTDDDPGPSAA